MDKESYCQLRWSWRWIRQCQLRLPQRLPVPPSHRRRNRGSRYVCLKMISFWCQKSSDLYLRGFYDHNDSTGANYLYKPSCFFGFNIMDEVVVPDDIEVGDYVLSFRWDCEQTPQVWNACSTIKVVWFHVQMWCQKYVWWIIKIYLKVTWK